jgi:HK97 family phage major capsid protein
VAKGSETMISVGSSVKALGNGRIGGHLVVWGDPTQKDFYGDYFKTSTYLGAHDGNGMDVAINHRVALRTGDPAIDGELKALADRLLKAPMQTKRDAVGVFAETVCDMADEYEAAVYHLAEAGKLKWSAGAAPHLVDRDEDGGLKMFVISEGSLTPIPAEPRMLSHRVLPLKAFMDLFTQAGESGGEEGMQPGNPAGRKPKGTSAPIKGKTEVKAMGLLEAIKMLVPKISDEQAKAIAAILGLAGVDAGSVEDAAGSGGDPAATDMTAAPTKSFDMVELVKNLKSLGYPVQLPGQGASQKTAATRPVYNFPAAEGGEGADPEAERATKSINAVHAMRFTGETEAEKAILNDLIGTDYRQKIYEQNQAYAKYLRGGERALDGKEYKALKSLYFPTGQVTEFVRNGMSVLEIKATQVEAIGEMGGLAVPPNVQAEISARLPGLTAVRGAGARVITLAGGNSIEIPQYRGTAGDNRYVGLLRGAWGTETQAPPDKNFKLDMITVIANIYTYKVPYSMSMIEDAANLVSFVNKDIGDVEAMDEDEAFLVGDGVGKPLGILPGGANTLGLTQIHSGAAATLTAAGIKSMKRAVPTQYRKDAVWVANSDTYGIIEGLNNAGVFYFPDLAEEEKLLARRTFESEVMADVGAGSLSLLFAAMAGYTIVERLGMTIERFHDSGTGANKVEFHVRRRVGGRIEKPWMFAVQETAA